MAPEGTPTGGRAEAARVLGLAAKAAGAYERPDLAERIEAARRRLGRHETWALVVGEFKQGKSSLVNALLGVPVCPVDDDVATSVPTAVRHAERPWAQAVYEPDDEGDDPRVEPVDLDDLAGWVSEAGNPDNRLGLRRLEVGLPHELLAEGLVLVDTPGVGGLGSAHQTTTITALPAADAVVLVSDASSEYTEPELAFLDTARQLCPNIICALTKIDFYPSWRKVLELDAGHLRRAGVDAEILPVSATLRAQALEDRDATLNRESGYDRLGDYLRRRVIGEAEWLAVRSAAHAARSAADQLRRGLEAERTALADPDGAAELVGRLREAKERAEQLQTRAARWQQTLSDGVADLSSDIDYDLRSRIRTIGREGEDAIDAADPADTWEQFEQWLYRRVHAEVAANYALLTTRAHDLADTVAEHFGDEQRSITPAVQAPGETLDRIEVRDDVDLEGPARSDRGLNVLRSSYGGMFMFGMLGRAVGLGLVNPFSIAMGVVLGRKALKQEREREVERRRQEAKTAQRKYLDEVSFEVGKDSRDTLRRVQRSLRDHFTVQAEELQRSAQNSLAAAEKAVQADQRDRKRRLADVDAELERLRALHARVDALDGGGSAERPSGADAARKVAR